MDIVRSLIDFVVHIDAHLADLVARYGAWIYGILFLIVFCETGLVVAPLLPGDSLLFAAGALAASTGKMNVFALWGLLTVAAILGDAVNYAAGARVGQGIFKPGNRVLKLEYLRRTEAFYDKHGNKTIILARFVPIVRTFAPFVAGVGSMSYARFATYNVVGGVAWTTLFLFGGYGFGNIPFVQEHFEWVTIAIVVVSVLPIAREYVKHRRAARGAAG
jgi:membrane-associated protein